MHLPTHRRRLLLGAGLLMAGPSAWAFPERPMRLVVPWAPGGSTDALARVIGQRLAATLGQEVLVDNRPGAAGTVGLGSVAKSAADGYTLAVIELPHVLAPLVTRNVPYDLERDFKPIGLIGTSALALFTSTAVPAQRSFNSWLAEARAAKLPPALAHSGNGSLSHLASELFNARTGIQFNLVPYRGSAPALTDVAGGLVGGHFATVASASALMSAGRVQPVAVASAKRLPVLPAVPTLAELGIPDLVLEQWWGLVAPTATPDATVERIRTELLAALGHVEVRERLRVLAVEKQPGTAGEFSRFIRKERVRWTEVAKRAGLKPE
jgi:tripartite-type tricarboxylate transporter receptor subunit TctC